MGPWETGSREGEPIYREPDCSDPARGRCRTPAQTLECDVVYRKPAYYDSCGKNASTSCCRPPCEIPGNAPGRPGPVRPPVSRSVAEPASAALDTVVPRSVAPSANCPGTRAQRPARRVNRPCCPAPRARDGPNTPRSHHQTTPSASVAHGDRP